MTARLFALFFGAMNGAGYGLIAWGFGIGCVGVTAAAAAGFVLGHFCFAMASTSN